MSYDSTIGMLQRKKEEEESTVGVSERFDAFPWDGAIAFMKAMQCTSDWAQPVPQPSFWLEKQPPRLISIKSGVDEVVEVIWRRFEIP